MTVLLSKDQIGGLSRFSACLSGCQTEDSSTILINFLLAYRLMTSRTRDAASVLTLSLFFTLACPSLMAQEQNSQALPPSWKMGHNTTKPRPEDAQTNTFEGYGDGEPAQRTVRRNQQAWYVPRVALGVGLNVPELLPVEGYFFFGRHFGVRLFYTPPIPFNIRVEMPSDVISTKKGIAVANPDFDIRMKATYGAHYGAEALYFPFGGSFFLASGVSHRRMRLVGDAKSPVLVCSIIEAAKDPPCGDPNASIRTRTELGIKADAETTALLVRAAVGGFWNVGSFGYFMMNAGVTKPTHIERRVKVTTELDTPEEEDEEVKGALAQVKSEREADLHDKALAAMKPVEEKILPIFGIAAGVRF